MSVPSSIVQTQSDGASVCGATPPQPRIEKGLTDDGMETVAIDDAFRIAPTAEPATLRDFVEGLKRMRPTDIVKRAESLACASVYYTAATDGSARQHTRIHAVSDIGGIDPLALDGRNAVCLCGEGAASAGDLIQALEPLVPAHGHLLFAHNYKRVVLASCKGQGHHSVGYAVRPITDDRPYTQNDLDTVKYAHDHHGALMKLCSDVLLHHGNGPIDATALCNTLTSRLPGDKRVDLVLIKRTLMPLRSLEARLSLPIGDAGLSALFRTYTTDGHAAHVPFGQRQCAHRLYIHVALPGITVNHLDMIYGNEAARAHALLAAVQSI